MTAPRAPAGRIPAWRTWTAALLAFGGLVVAVATTGPHDRPPLDPPLAWAPWAAAALGSAALLGPTRSRWPAGLAGVALVLYALHGHLRPGFPIAHDREVHLWGIYTQFRCLLDGDPWPRWNPYLGLGMPLLQYYPPAMLYLGQAAMAVGGTPVQAGVAVLAVAATLAYAGHAWAASRLGCARPAALLAGAAATLAPYRLFDQTYRFALGELLGLGLLPVFLVLGREAALLPTARRVLLFTAAAALLLLTHPLTALMGGVLLGVWLTAESALDRAGASAWARRLGVLAGASLLGAASVGAWLVPAAVEHGDLALSHFVPGPGRPISRSALDPGDWLRRRVWTVFETARGRLAGVDPADALPFYAGAVLLGLALAGVVLGKAARPPGAAGGAGEAGLAGGGPGPLAPSPLAMGGAAALALALTCGVGWQVVQAIPSLRSIQFLWRFLGPATVICALLAGLAAQRVLDAWPRAARAAAIAALLSLVWDAAPYTGTTGRLQPYQDVAQTRRARPAPPGEQWLAVDLPEGVFVRAEALRYPPSRPAWRVAKSRRVYPEYMPSPSYDRYYKPSEKGPDGPAVAAGYGVSWLFRDGARPPRRLSARSLVTFRKKGEETLRDLDEATLRIQPERLSVELPEGHGPGRVRVAFAWYPGWSVRVDGGPARPARRSAALLAVDVGATARRVEFAYTWATPPRRAGQAASMLGLVAIGALAVRARRPLPSPP